LQRQQCLADAGVYNFHSGISQGASDVLGSPVVSVKTWFAYQHSYFSVHFFSKEASM
jgi:hypothetical protein